MNQRRSPAPGEQNPVRRRKQSCGIGKPLQPFPVATQRAHRCVGAGEARRGQQQQRRPAGPDAMLGHLREHIGEGAHIDHVAGQMRERVEEGGETDPAPAGQQPADPGRAADQIGDRADSHGEDHQPHRGHPGRVEQVHRVDAAAPEVVEHLDRRQRQQQPDRGGAVNNPAPHRSSRAFPHRSAFRKQAVNGAERG